MQPNRPVRAGAAPALTLYAAILCQSCGSAPQPVQPTEPSHALTVAGDEVRLRVHQLPVADFVKVAQQVTNKAYTFDQRELADRQPISLVGEMRCARSEFDEFFETVLQVHGLGVIERQTDVGTIVEVRAL